MQPPAEAPMAFVEDLERPELDDDDRHHLSRVLRLKAGEVLVVSDGEGRWRACRMGEHLEPSGPISVSPQTTPSLGVGFALVKGGRPELVVQKLTELGIDRILPFVAERSVVRWDPQRAEGHERRLRKVAREAAMQSRRTRLPIVEGVGTFAELVVGDQVAGADRGGEPPSLAWPTILIGPEGGWSPSESEQLGHKVGLGDLVLRAETAAITAGSMLSGLRSGLLSPISGERGGSGG